MKSILFYKTKLVLAAIAVIIIASSFTSAAPNDNQRILFTHISPNEGLSQGIVVSCCQDSLGHMWFATHDGLNRYDGYRFTVYRNNPDDSTSVADNLIRKVYTDSKGGLWVGTEKGLSFYDREKDIFRNYPIGGKSVTGIVDMEADGKFLVAAGGSLRIFDSGSNQWLEATPPHQKESFGATIIYKTGEQIWIGTKQDGLFCYIPATNELTKVSSFRSRKSIQCIAMDEDGKLWVATEGDGLIRLNISTGENAVFKHNPSDSRSISSNLVRTISTDTDGRIWVGTFNGLSIFEDGQFQNIYSDPFSHGSLSQSSVRCITRDSQGGMWLGTWLGGINYWHLLKNRFINIRREANGKSLNDNIISCITEDNDGSLWIGTKSGGVNHYNNQTGKFSYYSLEKNIQNNLLESNDIKAIYVEEKNKRIYVGAHAGGLNIIDRKTGSISHNSHKNPDGTPLDVYAIIPSDENHLWIGTLDGLWEYEISSDTFTPVIDDTDGESLKSLRITTLLEDSQSRLWVGGENGLKCYIRNKGENLSTILPHYVYTELGGKFVQCIFESSTKLIWISTRSGMYCYDEREQAITHYTTEDGLPSDIIHGMEEDSFGRLWISTDNGLSCFNPFSGTFRNFSVHDGLQSNQFNRYSHCMKRSGEMMFGGINGITTFYPQNLKDNPFTPAPQITSIQVSNRIIRPGDDTGILDKAILLTEAIELDHDQNSISIEITVPDFLSGQNNTFAYILEGFDKEWQTTENSSISYSNLPHGRYRLMLKAANNDGKWNDKPTVLEVRIKPIWYRTIVAKAIFLILILMLIYASYRIIVERKERENREELAKQEKAHQEDMHQMKMRFFINISHEMRTPLTLILNPLQEMISKSSDTWMRKQLKYVERNAKRLMHLINQLMDYRRAELGVFKLKIRPENVHKIIKESWSYYERLAQSRKLQYSLLSELEGKTLYIDGQYLELILNNLLSNAFKYTDTGSITVRAMQKDEQLYIEVSDTGKGIPAEEQERIFERFYQIDNEHIGSGIGLSLVQKLVDLHHGKITLKSTEGAGSTFLICLPLSLAVYSAEELGNHTEVHTLNSLDHYIIYTEQPEQDLPETLQNKRGKLLIAEDNEEIRTYMSNSLSGIFDIVLAENGEEALKLVKEDMPDIVISDMMMPIMDGLKLCAAIKQNISTSHIPVIMLSAKTDSKDQMDALKSGADDYITKPFSMAVLIAKIQNILRTYHRVHDKATKSMEIAPERISYNAMDEELLKKAISIVERNIDNSDFSTEEFASEMNMSRSNLHLKLKALTGESALDFIRKIRFKEACRLLKDGRYSISEISDMVGFNTPSYFATCFKKYMGCLPTEYVKNLK